MVHKVVNENEERMNYLIYLHKSGRINAGAKRVIAYNTAFYPEFAQKAMGLYREARYKELSDLCSNDNLLSHSRKDISAYWATKRLVELQKEEL